MHSYVLNAVRKVRAKGVQGCLKYDWDYDLMFVSYYYLMFVFLL